MTVSVSVDAMPTGSGTYLAVLPRSEAGDGYQARLKLRADGSMQARWQRVEGGAAVTLAVSEVAGLSFAAGDTLMLRAQALGTGPTQLRFKVWAAGQSEPAGWAVTASDADPDWQRTGAPALFGYVTSDSTGPSVLSWDDLAVTAEVGAAPKNVAPAASFTAAVDGRTVSFDGSGSSDSDGSVVSYAWDFGDGVSASGAVVEHTYAADGPFDAVLTVVDDDGAEGTAVQTLSFAGDLVIAAADAFERSVASGWGTADTGGEWSSCSTCSVAGGVGAMSLAVGQAKRPGWPVWRWRTRM